MTAGADWSGLGVASVKVTPGCYDGASVVVGGADITAAVRSLVVRAAVDQIPELELELVLPEVTVDGEVRVCVLDRVREALIALGWTPPEEG